MKDWVYVYNVMNVVNRVFMEIRSEHSTSHLKCRQAMKLKL